MTLRDIETALDEADAQVVSLVRNEMRVNAPQAGRKVLPGDILIIEAEVEALASVLSSLGLTLEEAGSSGAQNETGEDETRESGRRDNSKAIDHEPGAEEANETAKKAPPSDEIVLMELVVRPESAIAGRSASDMLLRSRYGLNLLAVLREGTHSKARLRTLKIQPGDLLLMQGSPEVLAEFAADSRSVPLAERELRIPNKRKAWMAGGIMAFAVAVFGLLPTAISFALGVLASMALRTVPPRAALQRSTRRRRGKDERSAG